MQILVCRTHHPTHFLLLIKVVHVLIGSNLEKWVKKLPNFRDYQIQKNVQAIVFEDHVQLYMLTQGRASMTGLKCHGGWKSASVAEGYIADLKRNKMATAKKVINQIDPNLLNSFADHCITNIHFPDYKKTKLLHNERKGKRLDLLEALEINKAKLNKKTATNDQTDFGISPLIKAAIA
ncbi:hypothetical protein NQ317_016508 [Molorchus minor]|uniref:Uncharacterized protein n=1 Tax=Molorchus minor TaxID=1323400 RepID=A0ABQ9JCQ9_9CUCU|nr:hypothetical protein NQ317_016508 [Molorchus minor]